jgi:CPA2 family monovalent cation:H+ antiporter-2
VLLGLAVLAVIAGRIGLSPIPLYLLVGLLFGAGGPFRLQEIEGFIEVGAEVGVVLLLFLLGLEYSPRDLARGLRTGWSSGLIDLVLNGAPGVAAGFLLGFGPLGAAALGGVTYISSSGVIAKLIGDLGFTGNRETGTVLTLLVVEDLVMAVYLPLLAAALLGANPLGAALAVALVALVLVVLLRPRRREPRWLRAVFGRSDEAMLLGILGVSLVVGALADRLGVSAAVAAFLIGLSLSGETAERAARLLHPLRDLFAAAFFLFFGLQVDLGALGPVAAAAAALGALTAATKVFTGWWAARADGVGTWGRRRAAAMLVSRGEFSIVIAELAIAAGLDARIGTLSAAYVMALAIVGPLAVRVVEAVRARQGKMKPLPSGSPGG